MPLCETIHRRLCIHCATTRGHRARTRDCDRSRAGAAYGDAVARRRARGTQAHVRSAIGRRSLVREKHTVRRYQVVEHCVGVPVPSSFRKGTTAEIAKSARFKERAAFRPVAPSSSVCRLFALPRVHSAEERVATKILSLNGSEKQRELFILVRAACLCGRETKIQL